MTAHAVAALSARFQDNVPSVLWTPPDPRYDASGQDASGEGVAAGGSGNSPDPGILGHLTDDEHVALTVLAAPQIRIEGRISGAIESKLCLARSGAITSRVQRTAGTAVIDLPFCDGTPAALAAMVAPFLGSGAPADPAVCASFPAAAGRAAVRAGDHGQCAAQLRGLGLGAEPARLIAKAFTSSRRSAEFTLYPGEDRCAAVVAVIDSAIGRIVVSTAAQADSGSWTSVAEGSAHRIGRALARACEELPGGGWTP